MSDRHPDLALVWHGAPLDAGAADPPVDLRDRVARCQGVAARFPGLERISGLVSE